MHRKESCQPLKAASSSLTSELAGRLCHRGLHILDLAVQPLDGLHHGARPKRCVRQVCNVMAARCGLPALPGQLLRRGGQVATPHRHGLQTNSVRPRLWSRPTCSRSISRTTSSAKLHIRLSVPAGGGGGALGGRVRVQSPVPEARCSPSLQHIVPRACVMRGCATLPPGQPQRLCRPGPRARLASPAAPLPHPPGGKARGLMSMTPRLPRMCPSLDTCTKAAAAAQTQHGWVPAGLSPRRRCGGTHRCMWGAQQSRADFLC